MWRPPASREAERGIANRISDTQPITSGTLIRKIHRQEAIASSSPPASGPSTPKIAPHAGPAADRLSPLGRRKGVDDHSQRAGHEQRAKDALHRPRRHQRGSAAPSEATPISIIGSHY